MKTRIINAVSILLIVILMSLVNVPASPVILGKQVDATAENSNEVITVSNVDTTEISYNEVLASRFLNMLNHNFVYDDSFLSVEDMINDSMPALVEYRVSEEDNFIEEAYVNDYLFNMYGVEVEDYSLINTEFDRIEGYVYIIPRGYALFEHKINSITQNEDGSYTVTTNVTITTHDSGVYTDICETLFVKNELSQFGYSIIHSNIGIAPLAA